MDADEQGICRVRAYSHAFRCIQEPGLNCFVGVIGVHRRPSAVPLLFWIPACAGMTTNAMTANAMTANAMTADRNDEGETGQCDRGNHT